MHTHTHTHTFSIPNNKRCSLTVSLSKSTLCCGQRPKLCRMVSISVKMLCLLMTASQEVGVNRPVRMDMVVVFPALLCTNKTLIWS